MSKKEKELTTPQKFAAMRRDMNTSLIERSEEIDVILTALICNENPLLVGPPGTAKSLMLDTLLNWLDKDTAKKFSLLVNKYTTAEEVYGPISVKGLKEDQYRRITTGKLPEAHFAFIDEINTMVSAL